MAGNEKGQLSIKAGCLRHDMKIRRKKSKHIGLTRNGDIINMAGWRTPGGATSLRYRNF